MADADRRGGVRGAVRCPVTAPVETVAVGGAGRRRDRGDSGQVRERGFGTHRFGGVPGEAGGGGPQGRSRSPARRPPHAWPGGGRPGGSAEPPLTSPPPETAGHASGRPGCPTAGRPVHRSPPPAPVTGRPAEVTAVPSPTRWRPTAGRPAPRGADGGRTLWARGRIPGILSGVLVQQAVDEGAVLAQGEAEGLGVRVGRGLPGAAQRGAAGLDGGDDRGGDLLGEVVGVADGEAGVVDEAALHLPPAGPDPGGVDLRPGGLAGRRDRCGGRRPRLRFRGRLLRGRLRGRGRPLCLLSPVPFRRRLRSRAGPVLRRRIALRGGHRLLRGGPRRHRPRAGRLRGAPPLADPEVPPGLAPLALGRVLRLRPGGLPRLLFPVHRVPSSPAPPSPAPRRAPPSAAPGSLPSTPRPTPPSAARGTGSALSPGPPGSVPRPPGRPPSSPRKPTIASLSSSVPTPPARSRRAVSQARR